MLFADLVRVVICDGMEKNGNMEMIAENGKIETTPRLNGAEAKRIHDIAKTCNLHWNSSWITSF